MDPAGGAICARKMPAGTPALLGVDATRGNLSARLHEAVSKPPRKSIWLRPFRPEMRNERPAIQLLDAVAEFAKFRWGDARLEFAVEVVNFHQNAGMVASDQAASTI